MELRRQFASDNNAGICPEAMAALAEANRGHVPGYGDDPITAQARAMFNQLFEKECVAFFVSNGTAANCLALAALLQPFHAVIAHACSHLETDEANALGRFAPGAKILLAPGTHGKIDVNALDRLIASQRPVHSSKPAAISLTNATELGTVYRPAELAALASFARERGFYVHLDGARLANAAAGLSCSLAELTWKAGVDVVSFGGTKNGLGFGEAVVFFRNDLAKAFDCRMKQAGQLASKMRFLAAPWIGLLRNEVWRQNGAHANAMADRLERRLSLLGVLPVYPREANALFVHLPVLAVADLHHRGWHFYTDVGPERAARLMCSWDTIETDVDSFAEDLAKTLAGR
jgi:threonine aldolase